VFIPQAHLIWMDSDRPVPKGCIKKKKRKKTGKWNSYYIV